MLLWCWWLALTIEAAPIMIGIRNVTDPGALQQAFERFWFWSKVRGVCQVFSYVAQLWALARLSEAS